MKIAYITFADESFKNFQVKNNLDLAGQNITCIAYNEKDIIPFMERHKDIFSFKRGFGYWSWKPYIVAKTLQEDYDYVVYCDAGTKLFQKVEDLVKYMGDGILMVNELGNIEKCWTKRDIFVKLNCDTNEFTETNQISATSFVVKNCEKSRHIIGEWLNHCCDKHLVTDEQSKSEEYPEFGENRHDQSLFSCVLKKHKSDVIIFPFKFFDQNFYLQKPIRPTLSELGTKYGTDKVSHGFTPTYDKVFHHYRNCFQKVAEIGVFFGASILMWKEYFPFAVIHGLDAFQGLQGNGSRFNGYLDFYYKMEKNPDERIKLHVVDQSKRSDLSRFVESDFDMIIDDGSHLMKDQQQSFAVLFSLVKPGGFFVMEDIHTSLQDGYDVVKDPSNTTLTMLLDWKKDGKWKSQYMTEEEIVYLNKHVKSCDIYGWGNSMTCVIKKVKE